MLASTGRITQWLMLDYRCHLFFLAETTAIRRGIKWVRVDFPEKVNKR